MAPSDAYNIDTYFREINEPQRAAFPTLAASVGHPAPSFSIPLLDGGSVALEPLLSRGHLVLVFGSFTTPPAVAQLAALETLHRTYGGRGFPFLYVYTREIHPGENFPPHRTMEQKADHARRMRDYARITFPVAIDDLQGTVHNAYGGLPSMAFVIHRDGTLVYRGSWTLAHAVQAVLEELLRWDRSEAAGEPGRLAYHESVTFMEREPEDVWNIVDLAGPKARADLDAADHAAIRRPLSPFRHA
jgi:hypothetical protein